MQLISYTPNQQVQLFGDNYVIQSVDGVDAIVLRSVATGATRTFEMKTLLAHHSAGNLRGAPDAKSPGLKPPKPRRTSTDLLMEQSDARKKDGARWREYSKAVHHSGLPITKGEDLGALLSEVAARRGDSRVPSLSSVKRWYRKFLNHGGDPARVVPAYHQRGGPGKPRCDTVVQHEIQRAIDNTYLTPRARPMCEAYGDLEARLVQMNLSMPHSVKLKVPSFSTFRRAILAHGAFEVYAARQGRNAAERKFRSTRVSSESFAFNECWEMDHTILDLMVVRRSGLPAKRPRFTAVIEWSTSNLMGFDVDFSGNSSQAALNCLRHAITPKTYVRERYPEIKGTWPCHGVPEILKVDNGMEFHSASLSSTCESLQIELQFCPVKKPWYKGRVERFFRTLSEGFLSRLPGAALPDRERRKDIEEFNLPVIDLETFERLLHNWIVDDYMLAPRDGK